MMHQQRRMALVNKTTLMSFILSDNHCWKAVVVRCCHLARPTAALLARQRYHRQLPLSVGMWC